MDSDIKKKFVSLACQMSPENLSCDGELPAYKIREKLKRLKKEWSILEQEVGRTVSEDEIW